MTNIGPLSNVTYEHISEQNNTVKLVESNVGYYYVTLFDLSTNVCASQDMKIQTSTHVFSFVEMVCTSGGTTKVQWLSVSG